MDRITPADVRAKCRVHDEHGCDQRITDFLHRLAAQMEADAEAMAGKVLVKPIHATRNWDGPRHVVIIDERMMNGNTPEEALANMREQLAKEDAPALADNVTREDVAQALVEVRAKAREDAWARLRNIAKESGVTAEEVIEKLEERRQAERDDAKEGLR